MKDLTIKETIKGRIVVIRGQKVILDRDISELYGVPTKRLNEQVKRNLSRFPKEFMFKITEKEKAEVVANCDHLKVLKFSHELPFAFTEHGVAMLSSVLNSEKAIQINIGIVRVFIRAREIASTNSEMLGSLNRIEEKIENHDKNTKALFEVILKPSEAKLLSPEKPYSNKKALRDALNSCEDYIFWVDKYFSKPGLDLLSEICYQKSVKNVKILMLEEKADEKFRRMIKDLENEMRVEGIKIEIRFLGKKGKSEIHDRWIISKNKVFNVPSTDTVARGQYSEIKETKNRPPFEKFWNESKELSTHPKNG